MNDAVVEPLNPQPVNQTPVLNGLNNAQHDQPPTTTVSESLLSDAKINIDIQEPESNIRREHSIPIKIDGPDNASPPPDVEAPLDACA